MSRELMDNCSKGWWERRCRGRRKQNGEDQAAQGSRGPAPTPSGLGWLVEGKGHCSFFPSRRAHSKMPHYSSLSGFSLGS